MAGTPAKTFISILSMLEKEDARVTPIHDPPEKIVVPAVSFLLDSLSGMGYGRTVIFCKKFVDHIFSYPEGTLKLINVR